eukprot:15447449-Alexandrium_andersonii.AAC.1
MSLGSRTCEVTSQAWRVHVRRASSQGVAARPQPGGLYPAGLRSQNRAALPGLIHETRQRNPARRARREPKWRGLRQTPWD